MSLCERGARGRFEGVVGSRRSSDVDGDASCCSSPLNCDMMPSRRVPQPGEPSSALVSVEIRSGLGEAPELMTLLISASLTLMLLRLGFCEARARGDLPLIVRSGEEERRNRGDFSNTTIDLSSSSISMSCACCFCGDGWMGGKGLLRSGVLGGLLKMSLAAIGDWWLRGMGGTGGASDS